MLPPTPACTETGFTGVPLSFQIQGHFPVLFFFNHFLPFLSLFSPPAPSLPLCAVTAASDGLSGPAPRTPLPRCLSPVGVPQGSILWRPTSRQSPYVTVGPTWGSATPVRMNPHLCAELSGGLVDPTDFSQSLIQTPRPSLLFCLLL